ncbi:MAG: hypothetical protein RR301_03805 [Clostridia bacterium]
MSCIIRRFQPENDRTNCVIACSMGKCKRIASSCSNAAVNILHHQSKHTTQTFSCPAIHIESSPA